MRRLVVISGCVLTAFAADFDWGLPREIQPPAVPLDNPMNAAKVELGRRLFYDSRMSVNGNQPVLHAIARNWPSPTGRRGRKAPRA